MENLLTIIISTWMVAIIVFLVYLEMDLVKSYRESALIQTELDEALKKLILKINENNDK